MFVGIWFFPLNSVVLQIGFVLRLTVPSWPLRWPLSVSSLDPLAFFPAGLVPRTRPPNRMRICLSLSLSRNPGIDPHWLELVMCPSLNQSLKLCLSKTMSCAQSVDLGGWESPT